MNRDTVSALVPRAMQGDEAAFAALCEHIAKDVVYICIRYTGDYHAGEDAAQEVLVHLQKNICRLRHQEAFFAWLNRVIMGICVSMRRRDRTGSFSFFEDVEGDMLEDKLEFLPPEWAEREETRSLVLRALATLPFKHQQVIYMFYLQGMPLREIAEALDVKEGNARVMLHRARAALKKRIETDHQLNLEEYSLRGLAAAPPMALLLQADLQSLVSDEVMARIIEAAGVAAGLGAAGAAAAATAGAGGVAAGGAGAVAGAAGAASSSLVSATALALAGTALAGIAVGGAVLASSSASPPPTESIPPQYSVLSDTLFEEAEEESHIFNFDSELEQEQEESIVLATSGKASSAPEVAAPPAAFTQTLQGRLALAVQGTETEGGGRYAAGFMAAVYRGEQELARTSVDEAGDYRLSFEAREGEEYTLALYPPASRHCAFASGAGVESLAIGASAGENWMPTIYLVDVSAPTGAVEFTDGELAGAEVVNPNAAVLHARDETDLSLSWQVLGPSGLAAEGQGDYAPLDALAASPEGEEYEVVFTATDAAGNTAEFRRVFWRQVW